MKGKNILVTFVTVMMLAVAISFVCAEDKVDLRLRLEKGQTYKMKTTQEMKINQMIPGQQQAMTINQKTSGINIYTVEDVQPDGSIVLKITHDTISFKQAIPMQNVDIEYDSANPSSSNTTDPMSSMVSSIFGAIVGQSFTVAIAPDGKVKEIKGADVILTRINEKINKLQLPNDAMRVNIETRIKSQYNEEALRANTENSFNQYPDKPIGIDDTWQKRTTVMEGGFPMIVDTIYTLKERKDGIVVIDIFAMIQTDRSARPVEMGAMKMQYNISGSVTGTVEMNESTGWTNRSNQNLRLNGSIMVQSPEMPQSMSIPISMSGTIAVEPY